MISCDTNILFPAIDSSSSLHERAREFLQTHAGNNSFCLCEQVLMELYCLIRNPSVCANPLSAPRAAAVIQGYRSNPNWRIIDVNSEPPIMNQLWRWAAKPDYAYRKIFDMRLAATLQQHLVKEFASCNVKDFKLLGFDRVWDPFKS